MSIPKFATAEFTIDDFLSTFGCPELEEKVMNVVNRALKDDTLPEFPGFRSCECKTSGCNWDEAGIIKRLKECGIWTAIEAKLIMRAWHKRSQR